MTTNAAEAGRFKDVVRGLFLDREDFITLTGNVNWMAVSEALPDVYYETLRKAVTGDRPPSMDLMEKVAALAGVSPEVFSEYQMEKARQQFDPKVVGWEQAEQNLRSWAEVHTRQKKKR